MDPKELMLEDETKTWESERNRLIKARASLLLDLKVHSELDLTEKDVATVPLKYDAQGRAVSFERIGRKEYIERLEKSLETTTHRIKVIDELINNFAAE